MEDLTLSLDFKPKTLAVGKARWYATGDNNAINIYDKQSQKWTHRLNSVKGYAFAQPARVYAQTIPYYGFQTRTTQSAHW